MYKTGFIVMTALLPTKGHEDLIRFGLAFMGRRGPLTVLLCSRSFEPISGDLRTSWLREVFGAEIDLGRMNIVHLENDEAPQNPGDHPNFWAWWGNVIRDFNFGNPDYIFASEPYGVQLAEEVGAEFIPYDSARSIRNISSTAARMRMGPHWENILDPARRYLNRTYGRFVLFGQESVGKTTLAQSIASLTGHTFLPEWARPYLETVGADLTEQKMKNILDGQFAQEDAILGKTPITILDTDVLSTIGYMQFKGWEVPQDWLDDYKSFLRPTKYFLLPDDVPFTPYPLRYGGDRRETTLDYWIDLLNGFDADWELVPKGSFESKEFFIKDRISNIWLEETRKIREFERD